MSAPAEPETMLDRLAGIWLEMGDRVRGTVADLDDDAVRALRADLVPREAGLRRISTGGPNWAAIVSDILRAELGYRHILRRAREVGADVYCCAHDCDARRCPTGAHD